MEAIVVEGGKRLEGRVTVGGAKNSALPILVAALLAEGESVICGVPVLHDVETLIEILRNLGLDIERYSDGSLHTRVASEDNCEAPYNQVKKMRASVCVLGPLVARRGHARVALPGGCVIGTRPIDLHLKGLQALGAKIEVKHGYVEARAKELVGREIYLGGAFGSSVLGTANVMMAACLAKGRTVIECAACEPEVQDLAHFLNKMGARIEGIGCHRLVIEGVDRLEGAEYRVIPDRIEAGTFLCAAAITRGDVVVDGVVFDHLMAVVDKLREAGVEVEKVEGKGTARPRHDGLEAVRASAFGGVKATDVTTLPYPGFPTDMQAQLMAVLSIGEGISVVTEKVYPDRFMHVAELGRMGADIRKEGCSAIIHGVPALSGAEVMASDLRASAALILTGLVAIGKTKISRAYHIRRGYEKIEEKLRALGANTWTEPDAE
ncbi:MAG: UDP-N-acetylglucosamine 1-carboxyvinyltransferase [Planctomycetes bacterium]|nr:UDP-N-acetylglucosamine 1-carboxyvinyltransferase [Planctomycetota bacterium]